MSLTTPRKPALVLFECRSGFVTVLAREAMNNSYSEIGEWLIRALQNAATYCVMSGVGKPDIHIIPTKVPQQEIDKLEVEELIVGAELQRETDGT